MSFLHKSCTFLLSLSLAMGATPTLSQETDFDQVEIETISLGDGIYMLVGEGGNIGVSVGEDGTFLIDDQFAPLTEKITAAISAISAEPVRFVFNTHWHFDHTGGNENFGKAGAVIVAHDNVRTSMSQDHFIEILQREIPASPPAALPIVTFNDTVTFHLNGETIHAFHVDPAHTDGDAIIHFQEANVIHTGDTYFNGFYPFIDLDSNGSINGMIAAVEKVLAMVDEDTLIIPGHGALSNQEELQAYLSMLTTVRDRVQAAIDEGMSMEDFIASEPTADLDADWGKGFLKPEQFLQIVYTDLAR